MKKLLRSTFGTLVVAAFFIIAPPTYARGGHGGGHGGWRHRHAFRGGAAHAKAAHFAGRARPGGGRAFHAGRAYRAGRGYYAARGYHGAAQVYAARGYSRGFGGYNGWGGGYYTLRLAKLQLLRLGLRLSLLRVLRILPLGILSLPLRILAVRELQLRVLWLLIHVTTDVRPAAECGLLLLPSSAQYDFTLDALDSVRICATKTLAGFLRRGSR